MQSGILLQSTYKHLTNNFLIYFFPHSQLIFLGHVDTACCSLGLGSDPVPCPTTTAVSSRGAGSTHEGTWGTQCSFCVASDTLRCELQKALSAGGSPVLGLSHLPGPAGLTWLLCSHGACMGAQWSHTRILQQK